jgi:hypothetical protein
MPADLYAHLRIRDQVLYVGAVRPVFGHQPEHVAIQSIADGRRPRLATAPAGSLQREPIRTAFEASR